MAKGLFQKYSPDLTLILGENFSFFFLLYYFYFFQTTLTKILRSLIARTVARLIGDWSRKELETVFNNLTCKRKVVKKNL